MTINKTPETLHDVLERGIARGLLDFGADLTGCTPSVLTGHIIRELWAAGMHPAEIGRLREIVEADQQAVAGNLMSAASLARRAMNAEAALVAKDAEIAALKATISRLETPQ